VQQRVLFSTQVGQLLTVCTLNRRAEKNSANLNAVLFSIRYNEDVTMNCNSSTCDYSSERGQQIGTFAPTDCNQIGLVLTYFRHVLEKKLVG